MADRLWWQTGVLYQVYPRSFQDWDGDGVGDLPGILRRLDYLTDLGIDALWLSPIFPSPMADFGYDISDYTDIDPVFGSLDDLDRLIEAAHERGLKILLDLVPNHTSDLHPWFLESRSSRTNPKRDWYIWHDPRPNGGPPTNWLSEFGGSAWEYDNHTGQYYYHAFLKQQPDLNWRNPAVCEAMFNVMRFWLERGVDGFRVDVIWHMIKDDQFRDNPVNPDFTPGMPPHRQLVPLYTADRPEVHKVIAGMRRVIDEFEERVLIGEIYLPIERLVAYYGQDMSGTHLPFNFALLDACWHARYIADLINEYEDALPTGGWPNWVLGNHDRTRVASRIGRDQTRLAAILLLTLRGTPTIYYGDELDFEQVPIPPDRVQDPFEKNVPGIGVGRDGCRTPMQWDTGPYAGFSTVEPWLPLAADWRTNNVETQRADHASLLNLYRRLIAFRRSSPALSRGIYQSVATSGDLLVYIRSAEGERILIVLNLAAEPVTFELKDGALQGQLMISSESNCDDERVEGAIDLRGYEGAVIRLDEVPA